MIIKRDRFIDRRTRYSYYPPWSRGIGERVLDKINNFMPLSHYGIHLNFKILVPYFLVVFSILISHLIFHSNDLLIFISYIILIPIFAILKFDGRIPIGYAILLLIIAAVILATGDEDLANQLAIYTYWLLVVGVICLTIEYIREERRKNNISKYPRE